MASLNKVQLIGHLGKDPEAKVISSGDALSHFSIATTDKWKDKATGEAKEATEWHNISFFGKLAEIANQYLTKGAQVYIEGSLRTRKYTDKDGIEKYATSINGSSLIMLGSKGGTATATDNVPKKPAIAKASSIEEEDIPF